MARIPPHLAGKKLEEKGEKLVRALALELTKRVVQRTPVDTGRARGNWHAAIGTYYRGANWELKDRSGAMTISQAAGVSAQIKLGQRWYLTNGLPYILSLEMASSHQAPAGMVRVSLAELSGVARDISARLRLE